MTSLLRVAHLYEPHAALGIVLGASLLDASSGETLLNVNLTRKLNGKLA